jgi:hypothetical protein
MILPELIGINFAVAEAPFGFVESPLSERVAYTPSGFIKRRA